MIMNKCINCEHYKYNFNGVKYCSIAVHLRVNDSFGSADCSYFKKKQ